MLQCRIWSVQHKYLNALLWLSIVLLCITHPSHGLYQLQFTAQSYNLSIFQDPDFQEFLTPHQAHMGIQKPPFKKAKITYNVKENLIVNNKIQSAYEPSKQSVTEVFTAESQELGDFVFLRLRIRAFADINREKQSSYEFTVEAILRAESPSGAEIKKMTTTRVHVTVLDKNENCPLFVEQRYNFTTWENATTMTSAGRVHTTDADYGINAEVFYYLMKNSQVPFRVDPYDGIIYPTERLDVSLHSKYQFTVRAIHRGDRTIARCELVSRVDVTIHLLANNRRTPEILVSKISEIATPGVPDTVYATLVITDTDSGLNGKIGLVEIIETEYRNYFQVVPSYKSNEYMILVKNPFDDLSFKSSLKFRIAATDMGQPSKTGYTTVEFHLVNQRSYNLEFPESIVINVSESSLVNSTVYLLIIDPSYSASNSLIQFTEEPTDQSYFGLNKNGGVFVKKSLDAETVSSVKMKFTVEDLNNYFHRSRTRSTLTIHVTDVNDVAPIVSNNATKYILSETSTVGTRIFQIRAYDPDISRTRLNYHLYGASKELPFALDPADPRWVIVSSPLDYETMNKRMTLFVKVTDSGLPLPRGVVARFSVELLNVNEFSPTFTYSSCLLWVNNRADIGTALGEFYVEDLEGDQPSISLHPIKNDRWVKECFSVTSQSRLLSLRCILKNHQNTKSFPVYLLATDNEGKISELTLSVYTSRRTFDNQIRFYSSSEVESQSDNVILRCVKSNFTERLSAQLARKNQFSNRLTQLYNRIEAATKESEDHHANKHRPEFTVGTPTKLHIQENLKIGSVVYRFKATDGDDAKFSHAGQLVMALMDGSTVNPLSQLVNSRMDAAFMLNQSSNSEALLVVRRNLDREEVEYYNLNLKVCDLGAPQLCQSTMLNIFLDDVNDNYPEFTEIYPPLYISEDTPIGERIAQFDAVDKDTSSQIRYQLINFKDYFKLHRRSGRLKLRQNLDREQLAKYRLLIAAEDNGHPFALTTTQEVTIIVKDANDHRPEFPQTHVELTVPEDMPINSYITTLIANDPDAGMNGIVTYSVDGSVEHVTCFKCDPQTGVITLGCQLQYDQIYELRAVASDQGLPNLRSDTLNMKIKVQGVRPNVYPPIFKNPLVYAAVLENQKPGTEVVRVTALDRDGQSLTYSIVGGSGLGRFRIDHNGLIRTNEPLDSESSPGYWLLVFTHDSGSQQVQHAFAEVYVKVEDVNDNYPLSVEPCYRVSIPEGTQSLSNIVRIRATDFDMSPHILRYKIQTGDSEGHFTIDPFTGYISSASKLIDREQLFKTTEKNEFELEIEINDGGNASLSSTVKVFIAVQDINDNRPTFWHQTHPQYMYRNVGKDMATGYYLKAYDIQVVEELSFDGKKNVSVYCVGRVFAEDGDLGENGTVSYFQVSNASLENKNFLGFDVQAMSGKICTPNKLIAGVYEIQVSARDHGNPVSLVATSPTMVLIEILKWPQTTVRNSLSGVQTLQFLDRLSPRLYVKTSDLVGTTYMRLLVVDALNSGNETINRDLVYTLSGCTMFAVDRSRISRTARLYLAEPLTNYAFHNCGVNITVTDGTRFLTHYVNVTVTPYNNHSPRFSRSVYYAELSESTAVGSPVVKLQATDQSDSDSRQTYSIIQSSQQESRQLFQINNEGVLSINKALDYEHSPQHSLLIQVSDSGSPIRSDFVLVNVRVLDTNEAAPQFLVPLTREGPVQQEHRARLSEETLQYRGRVVSSSPVASIVARLPAFDSDPGLNGKINYTILDGHLVSSWTPKLSGNWDSLFSIDATEGNLVLLKSALPYEGKSYELLIQASDMGTPPLRNSSRLILSIVPASGSVPYFASTNHEVSIEENRPIGTIVTSLLAQIDGSGPLYYRLISEGNELDLFGIISTTGAVIVKGLIDREEHGDFFRLIVETYGVSGRVHETKSRTVLRVNVIDVNDNRPEFLEHSLSGSVSEASPPGTLIRDSRDWPLTVKAKDLDLGDNGMLHYEITTWPARDYLRIDERTGAVSLTRPIDHESLSRLVARVQLYDRGAERLTALRQAVIEIEVLDVNDSPPEFTKTLFVANLILPTLRGSDVVTVQAADPDLNNPVQYRIDGGDSGHHFSIDSETGHVTINNPEISERIEAFLLYVSASDGTFTSQSNVTIFCVRLNSHKYSQMFELMEDNLVVEFPENVGPGVPVAQLAVRHSPAGAVYRYSALSRNPHLRVDSLTGLVTTTNAPLDREHILESSLLVIVRDRNGGYAQAKITVLVQDVNDYKPVFVETPYHVTFFTNTQAGNQSITVEAIDKDIGNNGTVRYAIESIQPYEDHHIFNLDDTSGRLIIAKQLSDEWAGRSMTIKVIARDQGSPRPLSSTTRVSVQLVSRHTPVFYQPIYSTEIREDVSADSDVLTVEASSPSGSTLLYTFRAGNEEDKFALDFSTDIISEDPYENIITESSGVIRVIDKLDYETKSRYDLELEVTDTASSLSSRVPVIINITDIDDEKPKFPEPFYSYNVSEIEPVGFRFDQINATDADHGLAGEVYYSLNEINSNSQDSTYFKIQQKSGVLTIAREIDYEKIKEFNFLVVAKSLLGVPGHTAKVPIKISVLDYNDNPPRFQNSNSIVTISDRSEPGSFVTMLRAHDPDQSSRPFYSLVTSQNSSLFRIDPHNGQITFMPPSTNGHWRRQDHLSLEVQVSDGAHSALSQLRVNLAPSNYEAPQFEQNTRHVMIKENLPAGTFVISISARDNDRGKYGRVSYFILSEKQRKWFHLDRESGNLTLKRSLDREEKAEYEILIIAQDGGSLLSYQTLFVYVEDVNDNAPKFRQPKYQLILKPSQYMSAGGSLLPNILYLKADDPDINHNGLIHYGLDEGFKPSKAMRHLIDINATSGAISLRTNYLMALSEQNDRIDQMNGVTSLLKVHSSRNSFFFKACDRSKEAFLCSPAVEVVLLVLERDPEIESKVVCFSSTVTENNRMGDNVAICKTEPPNLQGKWRLVNGYSPRFNNPQIFKVNSLSGFITVESSLDYETQSRYELTVEFETMSIPPIVANKTISIDVIDSNDCHPEFESSSYEISIPETFPINEKFLKIKAIDRDMDGVDKVTYELQASNSEIDIRRYFRIDSQGWIWLTAPIDAETNSRFSFSVIASDMENHKNTSSVLVQVRDVNDSPMVWTQDSQSVELSEDIDYPREIYRLTVTDIDKEDRLPVRFLMKTVDFETGSIFELDSASGRVRVIGPLDREQKEAYRLEFLSTDGVFTTGEAFVLTVIVTDVNDNAPVCDKPDYELTPSESTPPGTLLIQLRANDRDKGHNAVLTYSLVEGNPLMFSVEFTTGKLFLSNELDREKQDEHRLAIKVSDRGGLECFFRVRLFVEDENDNSPVFKALKLSDIPENAPVGSLVGKVHAEDNDIGLNRRVRYSLLKNSENSFIIDKTTGIIRVARPLDRERLPMHSLVVVAEDMGQPHPLSATASLQIRLKDVNDSPPKFLINRRHLNVSETTPVNTSLARLEAISADEGKNAEVFYRLVSTRREEFHLDRKSGKLTLAKSLDYEKNRAYYLTVEAIDGGEPPLSSTTVVRINVVDENDNKPIFPIDPYSMSIAENSVEGTKIGKVQAVDADSGNNGRVTYSFLPNETSANYSLPLTSQMSSYELTNYFTINSNSGQISVRKPLDHEIIRQFNLTVVATDGGRPPLQSRTWVLIHVEDLNDNAPTFDRDSYEFTVEVDRDGNITIQNQNSVNPNHQVSNSKTIGRIKISDRDSAPNGGPYGCIFTKNRPGFKTEMEGDECLIKVSGRLILGQAPLTVQINDNGRTALHNRVLVMVNVIRQSNVPPEIEKANISVTYYRLDRPLGNIANIKVKDRAIYKKNIEYGLQSSYGDLFSIDKYNGTIRANQRLDKGEYRLKISVRSGHLSSQDVVSVHVDTLTDEMIESACLVTIDNMIPSLFLMDELDMRLKKELSSIMNIDQNSQVPSVYILSIQDGKKKWSLRSKREVSNSVDILVAVYNPTKKSFFDADILSQRINTESGRLNNIFEAKVTAEHNICKKSDCGNGLCTTRMTIHSNEQQNLWESHKVSYTAPAFSLTKHCTCPKHYGGPKCSQRLNDCAKSYCVSPKICQPKTRLAKEQVDGEPVSWVKSYECVCPGLREGPNCERSRLNLPEDCNIDKTCYENRESGPLMFTGGSYMNWTLVEPQHDKLQLSVKLRTKQLNGSVISVKWNSLREFVFHLSDGHFTCSATMDGVITQSWLTSKSFVADGSWHRVRFLLSSSVEQQSRGINQRMNIEMTVDGIDYNQAPIEWQAGDRASQQIVMGGSVWSRLGSDPKQALIEQSFVGCVKDFIINGAKLPYQRGFLYNSADHAVLNDHRNIKYKCSTDAYFNSGCQTSPCLNGAACQPKLTNPIQTGEKSSNQFTCKCRPGYSGQRCSRADEPCGVNPCRNEGKCAPNGNSYYCKCPAGLSGKHCQRGSHCKAANPCLNRAKCRDTAMGPECLCPIGFRGARCEHDINECRDNTNLCNGRGNCINKMGSFYCNCSLGYTGKMCQREGLITLYPDSNHLGLTQGHVYIIVGILAGLFVAALITIVLLVCKYKQRFRYSSSNRTINSYEKDSRIQMLPMMDPHHGNGGGSICYSRPNSYCSSSMTPQHMPMIGVMGTPNHPLLMTPDHRHHRSNYIAYSAGMSPPSTPMSACHHSYNTLGGMPGHFIFQNNNKSSRGPGSFSNQSADALSICSNSTGRGGGGSQHQRLAPCLSPHHSGAGTPCLSFHQGNHHFHSNSCSTTNSVTEGSEENTPVGTVRRGVMPIIQNLHMSDTDGGLQSGDMLMMTTNLDDSLDGGSRVQSMINHEHAVTYVKPNIIANRVYNIPLKKPSGDYHWDMLDMKHGAPDVIPGSPIIHKIHQHDANSTLTNRNNGVYALRETVLIGDSDDQFNSDSPTDNSLTRDELESNNFNQNHPPIDSNNKKQFDFYCEPLSTFTMGRNRFPNASRTLSSPTLNYYHPENQNHRIEHQQSHQQLYHPIQSTDLAMRPIRIQGRNQSMTKLEASPLTTNRSISGAARAVERMRRKKKSLNKKQTSQSAMFDLHPESEFGSSILVSRESIDTGSGLRIDLDSMDNFL